MERLFEYVEAEILGDPGFLEEHKPGLKKVRKYLRTNYFSEKEMENPKNLRSTTGEYSKTPCALTRK